MKYNSNYFLMTRLGRAPFVFKSNQTCCVKLLNPILYNHQNKMFATAYTCHSLNHTIVTNSADTSHIL